MFEGRDRETKEELVKSITAEMVRITGCGAASVNVISITSPRMTGDWEGSLPAASFLISGLYKRAMCRTLLSHY